MKNHAQRMALTAANATHAMAKIDTVRAASALNRTTVDREDHGVTLTQRDDLGPRLHARSLLREHELAAGEICSGFRQQNRDLQRKHMLAVKILMQAVVVVRAPRSLVATRMDPREHSPMAKRISVFAPPLR